MVKPQVCDSEAEIRQLIEEDLGELVGGRQEVKITRRGGNRPVIGAIESYIPRDCVKHDEEDRDALYIDTGRASGFVFYISEIASIEVLSSVA